MLLKDKYKKQNKLQGIDAASMGRILSGLVQTGSWGCFDEFNRLDEATLSTISMYIQQIQNALLNQITPIIFLDKEVCRIIKKLFCFNVRDYYFYRYKLTNIVEYLLL